MRDDKLSWKFFNLLLFFSIIGIPISYSQNVERKEDSIIQCHLVVRSKYKIEGNSSCAAESCISIILVTVITKKKQPFLDKKILSGQMRFHCLIICSMDIRRQIWSSKSHRSNICPTSNKILSCKYYLLDEITNDDFIAPSALTNLNLRTKLDRRQYSL